MGIERGTTLEKPIRMVRLAKVLSITSVALSLMSWFYAPGHLFYYLFEFLRPRFPEYTQAACGSTIPLAAVVFGIWVIVLGRRECGTTWFALAIISVLVSGNLAAANFYISSAFWPSVSYLVPSH